MVTASSWAELMNAKLDRSIGGWNKERREDRRGGKITDRRDEDRHVILLNSDVFATVAIVDSARTGV